MNTQLGGNVIVRVDIIRLLAVRAGVLPERSDDIMVYVVTN